ncbi:glycosyltransferase [Kineococcus gynurae]|uniref:Glycosyltransferase n=1 Tax=Kineococcus gynurae TaxID=452979 RepID=A0ABV5LNP1_9ACTN
MRQIFTVGRGQFDNIGDAMLRRQLFSWLRESGRLHIFVGNCPDGYEECLGVTSEDVTYRDLGTWYRAAVNEGLAGRASYAFKPGEIQLSLGGMKEHLVVVPLLALLRARNGRVVRVGSGAKSLAPLPRLLMRPSIALSDLTRWRDDETADYLGAPAMPDLAFGEGASTEEIAAGGRRDVLVVSVRDDKGSPPYPSPEALQAVREFAARNELEIWTITQVFQDDRRARRLAEDLGGQVLGWQDRIRHDEHEAALRALYRRAAMVVSDRLHVVIAAFTEGAVPVAGLVQRSTKIARHMSTIGVEDISVDLLGRDTDALTERLQSLLGRREEFFGHLTDARERLDQVRLAILDTLKGANQPADGSGPAAVRPVPATPAAPAPVRASTTPTSARPRPLVHHLGRVGDVAGGMTQVLNGYLDGPFENTDVTVLTTRGNPGDVATGVRRALGAAVRIARLRSTEAVVVAHLSNRGSWLREGALLWWADRRGLPTVAHLHGSSFVPFARRHPKLVRTVLRSADQAITLSEETSEVVRAALPVDRVDLVPNAVPVATATANSENLVVFGGAVGRRKGVDVLLAAWEQLDLAAAGWRLVVAGPVQEPDLVRDLPGVEFPGALAHDALVELLGRSRVAVLPSRGEAMPVFVLEAMAQGNAVVATDVGGVAEVVGPDTGELVPAEDVAALAAALDRVCRDDAHRERLAANGRTAVAERFDTSVVFPALERIWIDALQRRDWRNR